MSVYKKGNTWWVDIGFAGKRWRKRSPVNTRQGALIFESALRANLLDGKTPRQLQTESEPQWPTFAEFSLNQWHTNYVVPKNAPSEIQVKLCTLKRHLIPFFGHYPVNEIPSLAIAMYQAQKQREGLANKTINNHLTMLSKCLKTAQEWLDFEKVPRISFLIVPPQPFDFLSPQEVQQFCTSIDEAFWLEAVRVALNTGLRRGELIALRFEDIDLNRAAITVRRSLVRGKLGMPKSRKERLVPLNKEMAALFSRIWQPSGFVFGKTPEEHYSEAQFARQIVSLCEKADMRRFGWHTLRHTFTTNAGEHSATPRAVQAILGHQTLKTTMRYMHIRDEAIYQAVACIDYTPRNTDNDTRTTPLADSRYAGGA